MKETVVIDNHPIKEVCHIKFLDVIIDNILKWKYHIDYISKKIAKGIGVIIKARKVFDKTTLLSIYNALILPYIGYCIHIWGNAYQTHLPKLHVLQNKIVRIIAGEPRRTSSDHLYCEINILKLKKLYLYAAGLCINMKMICSQNYSRICLKKLQMSMNMIHVMQERTSCTSQFTEQCVARNILSKLVLELGIISCKM